MNLSLVREGEHLIKVFSPANLPLPKINYVITVKPIPSIHRRRNLFFIIGFHNETFDIFRCNSKIQKLIHETIKTNTKLAKELFDPYSEVFVKVTNVKDTVEFKGHFFIKSTPTIERVSNSPLLKYSKEELIKMYDEVKARYADEVDAEYIRMFQSDDYDFVYNKDTKLGGMQHLGIL